MQTSVADALALNREVAQLQLRSSVNFFLGLGGVAFTAISVVLFVLNTFDAVCQTSTPCFEATDKRTFHLIEFWSAFLFNVLNVFVMVFSEKDVSEQFYYPSIFKVVVLMNVGLSLVCATLVTINTDIFEFPSHQIEYSNELTMAVIETALVYSVVRVKEQSGLARVAALVLAATGLVVPILQLALYNGLGFNEGNGLPEPRGEVAAHYLEFTFDMVLGCMTAWFAFGNKLKMDAKVKELLARPAEKGENIASAVALDQVEVEFDIVDELPEIASEPGRSHSEYGRSSRSCFPFL